MKNEKGRTQGLLIWSFFTAIMIIVVCAAVLRFGFGIDFSGKTINETAKIKENNQILTPPTPAPNVETEGVEVVPTMEDEISGDSVYVPTFQLVWNDLMDEVVKGPVEFEDGEEPDYLESLNEQLFKENDISEEYIYKKYGFTSNKLKEEILQGIKNKFNETSDVIDENEDWGDEEEKGAYTFYTMLKRAFNFTNPFDILDDGLFGGMCSDVQYFGIDSESESELYDQVHILFYNDKDNFAFTVDTKEGDELIFAKGIEGKTFNEIYKKVEEEAEKYEGQKEFTSEDRLKIPNLNLNSKKDYEEVCNKIFKTADGESLFITKAIQTIKLELDNEGGKIKSEAIIQTKSMGAEVEEKEEEPKLLFLDNSFTMFVREKEKDKPYFALNVEDMAKFQENVFVWGFFTAIMIIVVVFAVLAFGFKIKLHPENEVTPNKNVINESMIDKGVMIRKEDGSTIVINNVEMELPSDIDVSSDNKQNEVVETQPGTSETTNTTEEANKEII